jgi:hypothetical protein
MWLLEIMALSTVLLDSTGLEVLSCGSSVFLKELENGKGCAFLEINVMGKQIFMVFDG